MSSGRWLLSLLVLALLATPTGVGRADAAGGSPIPVFAYYYIWFDPNSWNRAKTDYPVLGRYSSDDTVVMRQHVEWAKAAGIRGFIVSWKSTPTLNRRLEALISVAEEEDFNLAVMYQGLDFDRYPLPAATIRDDLEYFAETYGSSRVFGLFGPPLVVWSGTREFSPEEVASVTSPLRDRLLILASEHTPEDYSRLVGLVDGDAYYWSSVNRATYPGYEAKLGAMSWAVHHHGGIWIAPAAPGFDARLVGGTQVIERGDGATLRAQLAAAEHSSPDVIGLISWNEFSENTHIEPSRMYGSRSLEVLADILNAPGPKIPDFESSEPEGFSVRPGPLVPLSGLLLLTVFSLWVIARRARTSKGPPTTREGSYP